MTDLAAGQKLALTLVLPAGNFPVTGTVEYMPGGALKLMLDSALLLNGRAFWSFQLTGSFAYNFKNAQVLA